MPKRPAEPKSACEYCGKEFIGARKVVRHQISGSCKEYVDTLKEEEKTAMMAKREFPKRISQRTCNLC